MVAEGPVLDTTAPMAVPPNTFTPQSTVPPLVQPPSRLVPQPAQPVPYTPTGRELR